MSKCKQCQSKSFKLDVAEAFDVSELLGTPFPVVMHESVQIKSCETCGKVIGHVIPVPEQLVSIVAILRACDPLKFSGRDIKYLRKSLCMKSKELAGRLKLSAEQYSRYENDKAVISEVYEKLLRAIVCLQHLESVQYIEVDISSVINLNILSARSIDQPFKIDLIKVDTDADSLPMKWKRQAA